MINFNIGEVLKEVGITGLMIAIFDALKNTVKDGAKEAGDVLKKKITEELIEEKRGEMLGFLRSLAANDLKASKTLLDRQVARQGCEPRNYKDKNGINQPYLPGDENTFVKLLTKLYMALDEPDEQNTRVQVFVWLGNLEDEEFDSRLEFLNHDVVLQYAKLLLAKARVLIDQFSSSSVYKQIDQKAAGLATIIDEKVQNPSWFGRLANRLIR